METNTARLRTMPSNERGSRFARDRTDNVERQRNEIRRVRSIPLRRTIRVVGKSIGMYARERETTFGRKHVEQ